MKFSIKYDLVGKQFGELTVLCREADCNERIKWKCQCSCGNIKYIQGYDLSNGKQVSCGCKKYKGDNLVGQKFGQLTAISKHKFNKWYKWKCICDCGGIKYCYGDALKKGKETTCGCDKKTTKNFIGTKFNHLTVTEQLPNEKNHRAWLCRCDCGNTIKVITNTIITRKINSCGCLRYQTGKKSKCWKGYGDISSTFWALIKRSAKVRNIEFDITIEEAWNVFTKQCGKCALTGISLSFRESSRHESKDHATASLDRIDSDKDYTIDNVQWVHKDINKMKYDFDQDYFIKMAIMIADHQKNKEIN